ncbi:ATP-dependent helicase/nuclease subunit B [Oxalobacteraceae bacterium GrIS 2.11]
MFNRPVLFAPTDQFWKESARHLIQMREQGAALDYSALRVIVPAYEHAQWLMRSLAAELGPHFIPPRMNTLAAWLDLQNPATMHTEAISEGERLMTLYAQLREHGWLKKLFSARKNTDLLPLAQTLIALSDELTEAMLPLAADRKTMQQTWQQALTQLPVPAQQLLSDEAQLVWQIWQSQLDGNDAISIRLQRLLELARRAPDPLIWINPVMPEGIVQQFLSEYAGRQSVQIISLDWRSNAIEPLYVRAWQELPDNNEAASGMSITAPHNQISLIAADSLEQEAQWGAQTILDWLQKGKSSIALIAQDRVVARRIRALLERAEVHVADETGWKLSTTRAASALAAWFDVIVTRADTMMVLDLFKSPYFAPPSMSGHEEKTSWVMTIEMTLLRANVVGGWEAITTALEKSPDCAALCVQLKRNASQYTQRKTLSEWLMLTTMSLTEFGITERWQTDAAGVQVAELLAQLQQDCAGLSETFSFAEWRVFINLQLEGASFAGDKSDQRVVMMPLNGARLRRFDAVLMVGCDAAHLPSQPQEVLFFTNAVRRECGLITREQRQRQQLRDFTELLSANPVVVMSWQQQQRAEDNPISPWIQRLNLCLQQAGLPQLPSHTVQLNTQNLQAIVPQQPRPSAAALTPTTLSASGYNSFIACPYQFFATRMLGLSSLDALSDMPEKRDYGGWLHGILKTYHDTLKAQPDFPIEGQQALLIDISRAVFADILQTNPAALGYSMRWEKVIPAYIEWSQRYAQSGWQFEVGEVWLENNLQWDGGQVLLRGQIDRIDSSLGGETAVLDYKTNTKAVLTKKLKQAEDQQLPFYGLLAESGQTRITSAHYVALEKTAEKIDHVSADDYSNWQQQLRGAIVSNMSAIAQGAALPAQGPSQVCQYCDVRGLCRKGAW